MQKEAKLSALNFLTNCWMTYVTSLHLYLLEPSDALHHQIISCQGPSFIKATDVHLASKGYSERLCTVHIWENQAWKLSSK